MKVTQKAFLEALKDGPKTAREIQTLFKSESVQALRTVYKALLRKGRIERCDGSWGSPVRLKIPVEQVEQGLKGFPGQSDTAIPLENSDPTRRTSGHVEDPQLE